MTKPLERAVAYAISDPETGLTWDIDGMAIDLMILIKVAHISRAGVHAKMDELYDEVHASIDFPTAGEA